MGNECYGEPMDCKCCKEPTLEEMIKSLPLQSNIKDEMIEKYNQILEVNGNYIDELHHCHCEINRLEKAVLLLSKMLAKEEYRL